MRYAEDVVLYHDNGTRMPGPDWKGVESKHIALRFEQLIVALELKWTMQGECIICRKKRLGKGQKSQIMTYVG